MQKYLILLGDIGGTNARLKIIDLRSNTIVAEKNYLSHSFPSLESVITQFQTEMGLQAESAYLALAGRVIDQTSLFTNVP